MKWVAITLTVWVACLFWGDLSFWCGVLAASNLWYAHQKHSTVIRELMTAIEFMRAACEHASGETVDDSMRLREAMSVGIRMNARHARQLEDYQQPSFWADVRNLRGMLEEEV